MKPKFEFSRVEVMHIALALFGLSFAFELVLFRTEIFSGGVPALIALFVPSLIAVGFAFVLHELGHKFMAQSKGLWSEFRAWPMGLGLAILMAGAFGFVFAAPGATMISPVKKGRFGYSMQVLKPRDLGEIGLIGPIINIILFFIFAAIAYIFPGIAILQTAMFVNIWLAIFNLIPLSVLDGQKVWQWSKAIWGGAMGLSVLLFILTSVL